MKIVFLDSATMGDTSLEAIAALGELVTYPNSTPEEALERVADGDVLIINKIKVDERLIAAAPRLKLICEAATGVNNIDLNAAAARGIPVRNVAGYSTDSVVQVTFMHILSLIGQGEYFDARVKNGEWSKGGIFVDLSRSFREIAGKRIGVIGMGAIGSKVAAVASAFGMEVCYFSTSGTSHCTLYPSLPLEELLRTCDVVSIHAPSNERTRGLIGAAQFAQMKPSAILINMGRGDIVDEAALAAALDAGVVAGAALDVFPVEPIPMSSPLLNLKNPGRLRLSPHLGWASVEARDRLAAATAQNIKEFIG